MFLALLSGALTVLLRVMILNQNTNFEQFPIIFFNMNKYVKYMMKELSDVSESVQDNFFHRLNICNQVTC